jgi:hypothetical protein
MVEMPAQSAAGCEVKIERRHQIDEQFIDTIASSEFAIRRIEQGYMY